MIDWHVAFNTALAAMSSLLGWLLRALWQEVKELKEDHETLTTKVHAIDLLVAGQYVTREEHRRDIEALFRKLDRIEQRIINGKFQETQ